MAHASIPRVAVQSRWTFVHFAIAPRGKRCQSAPPEVHVMRGLTAAKRRERRHAARSRTNGGEKWMALAQKLSARHSQTAIAVMGRVPATPTPHLGNANGSTSLGHIGRRARWLGGRTIDIDDESHSA